MDEEYKSFLAELGGGAPNDGGPSDRGGPRMGGGGPRSRPGDDLPDNCKLYVGNLSPAVTDAVLKSLMEPFGNVLHAVVLLDMTTGERLLASAFSCIARTPYRVALQGSNCFKGVAFAWSCAHVAGKQISAATSLPCVRKLCARWRVTRDLCVCRSEQGLWLCAHGQCRGGEQCGGGHERQDDGRAAASGAPAQRRPRQAQLRPPARLRAHGK